MATQLRARGVGRGPPARVVGRVTRSGVAPELRASYFRVVTEEDRDVDCDGYSAVLAERDATFSFSGPSISAVESLDFTREDHVAVVEPATGLVHVVYRPESRHNFLFATERCNSACVMCSQPPRDTCDAEAGAELVRIIQLIPDKPAHVGITGGEPLLLGDGLVRVIEELARTLPGTAVTMLSNGRRYSDRSFVAKLAACRHPCFVTSIAVHGSNAADHDFVAQGRGAFDETVQGLYSAARFGLAVELRVVLHAFTVPALMGILDFVYRNLPFVQHVALMGLEDMGYARLNGDVLWVDPVECGPALRSAVEYCHYRRIPVSLYNLPLCVLPEALWSFARQSISDHKNIYLDECSACRVRRHCAGLFQSSRDRHSRGIRAIV